MGLLQAKQDQLAARVAGMAAQKTGWLGVAQAAARQRLANMGLPGKRDEYWRFTDPASLTAAQAIPAKVFDIAGETPIFGTIDRIKLVFVDGIFDADASDDPTLAGVTIERLSEVGLADQHWAAELYGVLEARGQNPVQRPLAALNTGFAKEGALIRVTGKAARPVSLIYQHKSEVSDVMLHNCIKLDPGAELTLTENGPAAARFNKVTEVEIGAGARFHHVRAQGRDHERRAVTHIFARLAAGAVMKSFTMTTNGRLTRNEAIIELVGDDALCHLSGAALGEDDFHHDDTVLVTHQGQRCQSRQVFKKVLKNGAVGVFQGKILVKPGAQKTDGYQTSQALLLDEASQFLAKPELEIYADDVKCSHGSTTGAIDEGALYYLRSRGVPLKAARALLVTAFLAESIDEIEDREIAEHIRARLELWLARPRLE